MLNIEFEHHKGTQNSDNGHVIFYNYEFSSIVHVIKYLKGIKPGNLKFVRIGRKLQLYDIDKRCYLNY